MKVCVQCKREKELSSFVKRRGYKFGVNSVCKPCCKIYQDRYRKNNKEKLKKYRQDNQEKIRASYKSHNRTDKRRFDSGRYRSKDFDLVWELTFDQWKKMVENNECHYCTGPLAEVGFSLDRKDNTLGYLLHNVVPCCQECNRIKGHRLTYNEMISVANLLMQMRIK